MSFRRMRHVKAREFQGCDIAYDFSNPANLYDATTGGALVAADGAIARANDVSGGSGHMTQGTSGNRPLRKVAALNGMDVARFDGSNDYLTAGDVGDVLANPVEFFAVFKRTGAGALQGIFGKSTTAAGPPAGRWNVLFVSADYVNIQTSSATVANFQVSTTTSTALQLLGGTHNRSTATNGASVTQRRNGTQTAAGTAFTDSGASYNTSTITLIGALQNNTGTGIEGSSYFNGDFGECAKYGAFFNPAQRLRLELSRCRKWRIAS